MQFRVVACIVVRAVGVRSCGPRDRSRTVISVRRLVSLGLVTVSVTPDDYARGARGGAWMMTPDVHEVFPNAPLVLVTAQVIFAHEPRLNSSEVRDVVAEGLRGELPLLEVQTVEVDGDVSRRLRATNEQQTVSAVLDSQSLTIEATEYTRFDVFAALLGRCFAALEKAVGSVYVERAGLRYIDEVRPEGVTSTQDWRQWIAPALVASADFLPGRSQVAMHGVAMYEVGERSAISFYWGEVIGSSVVAPSPLARKELPEGRFFVLDADAFWMPEAPATAKPTDLVQRFQELHVPVSEVFQNSLTDKTKEFFRGGLK